MGSLHDLRQSEILGWVDCVAACARRYFLKFHFNKAIYAGHSAIQRRNLVNGFSKDTFMIRTSLDDGGRLLLRLACPGLRGLLWCQERKTHKC